MSVNNNITKLCLFGGVIWCLSLTGNSESHKIELRLPPRPPRIFTQAPAGVRVVKVRAEFVDLPKHSLTECEFLYKLKEEDDFNEFKIGECDGSIETAKDIEKDVEEDYSIIVTAEINNTVVATIKLRIEVTIYNNKGPSLSHSHYSQEILDVAPIGTALMALNGTDEEEEESNNELYYFIQDPSSSGLNPWLDATMMILKINYTTGRVKVSAPLFNLPESIIFYIGVADGGSPQRSHTSKLTLYIRNMSAPRNLKVASTSETSINICWAPPVLGSPDGYRITYNTRKVGNFGTSKQRGVANVTVNELYKNGQVYHGYGAKRAKVIRFMGHTNFTNLTYCYSIEDLRIFTLYLIKLTGWASENHLSMTSSPVTAITKKMDCSHELCNKGVCQEKRSRPGYTCICMDGYTGQHCDKFDPCSAKGQPCKNGICKWSDESPPHCSCNDDFIGEQCEWSNPCDDSRCLNDGQCIAENSSNFSCKCPPLYTGIHCEIRLQDVYKLYSSIDAYCSVSTTKHEFGLLEWPRTYVGNEATIDCLQSSEYIYTEPPMNNLFSLWRMKKHFITSTEDTARNNSNQDQETQAKRICKQNKSGKPFWGEPTVESCTISSDNQTDESSLNFFTTNNISNEVLSTSVDNMSNIVNKTFDRKSGRKIAKMLSNFLKINRTTLRSSKSFRQTAKKILKVITTFTENIQLKIGEQFKIREESILVSAKLLKKIDLPLEVLFSSQENSDQSKTNDYFKIPKSAVSGISGEEIRFKFVSFKDDRMFVDSVTNKSLNMPVFSVAVGNRRIHNINPPVTYSLLNNISKDFTATCVFWDETDNSWLSEGLNTIITEEGRVVCESSHLTAFSVLLDPVHTDVGRHSKILSVITYIGLALSTFALAITVATFVLFRSVRRDKSGMIVVNLSISLLLLNICFILASTLPANSGTCILFAVMLHYFVASTFAWMLVEALNMHQLLVTVFPSVETHFLLKRLFFGWLCPFLFVGIALSWNYRVYTTESTEFCVISSTTVPAVYYTTYLVPMILVLIVNCVVFGFVTKVLCQTRPESIINKDPMKKVSHKKIPVTLAQIRGAITVVALLGVTWITGAFAVGSARLLFQYLFCITTPLQGLVIFVVRVVHNAEARNSWYYFIVHGIRGHQTFPPSSLRTHSSCQNTSSINTQSTGTTPPTSVFVSALRAARRLSSVSSNLSKNKGSMKNKRRFSSPAFKDEELEVGTKRNIKNKLYSSTKEYNGSDQKQFDNAMCSLIKNVYEKSDQIDDTHKNSNIDISDDTNSAGVKVNKNYRESFFIPEFENKYEGSIFSSDLSTEIMSNIRSVGKESNENVADEETVKPQEQKIPYIMDVSRLTNIFNKEKYVFNVGSANNLQYDRNAIQDFTTKRKSMSLYQIETLNNNMAVRSTSKSNLVRFLSENTLDKIQSNDNSPLLGNGSLMINKFETKSQNRNHSLNPD